jgi:hypothetical protein
MWTVYANLSWKTLYARNVSAIQCANIVNVFRYSLHHGLEFKGKAVLIREKCLPYQPSIDATQLVSWTVLLSVNPRTTRVRLREHYIPVSSMETAAVRIILHILIFLYWNYGIKSRNPLTYSFNASSHELAKYNAVPNSGASQQR